MASKKNLLGMLAGALAFGMVLAGCENGVQEVEGGVSITKPQVAAPAITEVKTTDGKYIILSWDAVDNAGSYAVVQNQKDKKTISSVEPSPTNGITYKADGTSVSNSDPDKWNVKIPLRASLGAAAAEYRFGVRASAGAYDGLDWYDSGITWGAYTATVTHPYTALLGTWVKERATASERQKFEFESTMSDYYPISYTVYDDSGNWLTSGSLSRDDITGDTVSFETYVNGYRTDFSITAGKLIVSNNYYNYLNATYVKQ
jgi:hypothetical protein